MRNMPNSAYALQEKAQCVTWYNENDSTTTVRKKFCTRYQRTAPSRNMILNWVRNSNCEEMWKIEMPLEDLQ